GAHHRSGPDAGRIRSELPGSGSNSLRAVALTDQLRGTAARAEQWRRHGGGRSIPAGPGPYDSGICADRRGTTDHRTHADRGATPSPVSPVVSGSVLDCVYRENSSKMVAQGARSPDVVKNLLTPSSASRRPSPASRTTRSNSSGSNPKGPLLLIAVPPASRAPR